MHSEMGMEEEEGIARVDIVDAVVQPILTQSAVTKSEITNWLKVLQLNV